MSSGQQQQPIVTLRMRINKQGQTELVDDNDEVQIILDRTIMEEGEEECEPDVKNNQMMQFFNMCMYFMNMAKDMSVSCSKMVYQYCVVPIMTYFEKNRQDKAKKMC